MGEANAGWSRADLQCGQGVKHEKLIGQDLNPGHLCRHLCSVPFPDVSLVLCSLPES